MTEDGVAVSGLVIAPWPLRDDELTNPKQRMIVHAIENASIGDLAGLSYFDYLVSVDGKQIDDVHKPEFAPKITIISPSSATQYSRNSKITVNIDTSGKYPLTEVDIFVNDIFIGSSKRAPFSLSFTPNDLDVLEVQNRLKIIGYDAVKNKGEAETVFNVSI